MPRRLAVFAVCLLGVALPSAIAHADNPVLTGQVGKGDAFAIFLHDASGGPVRHLDPGTYTIQVQDLSTIHNFHLLGPGVDRSTDVEGTSTVTWTVTFQDGAKYTYRCDAHPTQMIGTFTVGTLVTPPSPLQLKASVGPGRTISLRKTDGTKLTALSAPTAAVITVNDRSKTDNFHLTGPGVRKTTGIGFRGHVTWKVNLAAGKYVYRSDKHKTLHGSFTVAFA